MPGHHFAPGRGHGRGRHVVALLGTALVLAASACSSSSGEGATKEGRPLPGIKEFGLNEEQYLQHIDKTQKSIAECMADAGFEYIPVDVKTIEAAQARVRTDPGYTRRSYKEKWGLGVTTRFDSPVRDTGLGPNLKIWRSLPKADQEAYSRTLWGDNPNYDFVFAFDEEDFSQTGGCTREAVSKVFAADQLKGTYVNPKDVLVENDPRIIEAQDKWTQCMRDKGYDYEDDQDAIIEDYEQRLEDMLDGDDPRTLTGQRLDELHKLQQEEIKVSLADLDCQIRYTDKVFREVEIEVFGQPVSG